MPTVALLLCAGILSSAQSNNTRQGPPDSPTPAERSIEDLNYLGGDAAMPPFSDSVIDVDSGFRRALFRKGLAFRVITGPQYTQNMLDAPVHADEQVYVGQRAFESMFVQPIFSADLRQLHLPGAIVAFCWSIPRGLTFSTEVRRACSFNTVPHRVFQSA
jgi:hypothetical protein